MALISLHNLRIAFGGPPVLDNVSLDIQKGQRICLLGRNGMGKSTLLKIICGELKADAGEIVFAPGLRIAHLAQDVPTVSSGTTLEAVAAGAGAEGETVAAYLREQRAPTDPALLQKLESDLSDQEAWHIEGDALRALERVQVAPDLPFASLSGGLRRRVFLARALVRDPEILLLDEPTNHLDLESIAWLENFLLTARLTVLFVTHDRRLLKKIATRIVEIDRGKVVDWSCDYTTFLERKEAVLETELKEWERFDKKLAQEEAWIRRGVKARRTRNEGRVRALKKLREEKLKRRQRMGNVAMTISNSGRSGEQVLEARSITFAYGPAPLIRDFSFTLNRGDRIGIIGPNGCGKTTLLNLLLKKMAPQKGEVEFGTNVSPLYFDQLRVGVDPEKTVWENVSPRGGDTVLVNGAPRHVFSYLQDFLFTSDRAKMPVKWLSGGERHRLMLARLFTEPANLLVFDEPTNDLDAETLALLEEILQEFKGTLIVVSHDREFLNNIVTSALIFGKAGELNEYIGGYDDWEKYLAPESVPAVMKEKPPVQEKAPAKKKLTFEEKKAFDALPALIEALETEQRELNLQLADFVKCQKPGFVVETKARIASLQTELADAYRRWETLEKRSATA